MRVVKRKLEWYRENESAIEKKEYYRENKSGIVKMKVV